MDDMKHWPDCESCGVPVHPGVRLTFDDGTVYHADCVPEYDDLERELAADTREHVEREES